MTTRTKVILTTLIIGIAAFFLGNMLWPPSQGGPTPTSGQLPFFMALSALEALLFGLGIAFLIFGWPLAKTYAGRYGGSVYFVFAVLVWSIVSWWPHDHLHAAIGDDLQKLLYIEYLFHLTLMIGAVILAWAFVTATRRA